MSKHRHAHHSHGHAHAGHEHQDHVPHRHEPGIHADHGRKHDHAQALRAAPAVFSLLEAGLSRRLALVAGALAVLWPVTFWALR